MSHVQDTQLLVTQQLEMLEIIESVPDVILITRADGQIRFANSWAARTFSVSGADQLVGRMLFELLHPEDAEPLRALFRRQSRQPGNGGQFELRIIRSDGTYAVATLASLRQIEFEEERSVLLVARDISEEKALRSQVLVVERMASLGTLAAGVAHEINNPLAFVSANLDFIKAGLEQHEQLSDPLFREDLISAIAESCDGAKRIRTIVQDLKTFSRADDETTRPIDIEPVVRWAVKITGSQGRHRCRIEIDSRPAPQVNASDARLGQVMVNLIVNAIEAFPQRPPDDNLLRISIGTAPDGGAMIEVRDNGAGIGPERLARIFDPFFTTKPIGQGTGLGLSVSHGIIESFGGRIDVTSELGVGTAFQVTLPRAAFQPVAVADVPLDPATIGPRLRVMIIDDDVAVASALRRMLMAHHEVVVVSQPERAIELVQNGERFDALLCDVMMPGITGIDVYQRISAVAPQLRSRMVFMTGGVSSDAVVSMLGQLPNPKLQKPFDLAAVQQAFRGVVAA